MAQASGAPLSGGVALVLSAPIDLQVNDHDPLPNGTGNGLSAIYYALLLLLAGFTGSIIVSSLVDSMLGFVPAEIGPVYRFAEQFAISRFPTLLLKWGLMVVVGLLIGGIVTRVYDHRGLRRIGDPATSGDVAGN